MITEKQIDLFEEIEAAPCCIFHCISADKAMGAGIAKPMQEKFHIRENWPVPPMLCDENYSFDVCGCCIITPADKDSIVFNLVTKAKYWQKPTYQTLKDSLCHALSYFGQFEKLPKKIVMPRIGCGLDKLDWAKVKPMIEEIFADFNVVVCYL